MLRGRCRKLEAVRIQLEGLLDVRLEGDHTDDDESMVQELLAQLEAHMHSLEGELASAQQQREEVSCMTHPDSLPRGS